LQSRQRCRSLNAGSSNRQRLTAVLGPTPGLFSSTGSSSALLQHGASNSMLSMASTYTVAPKGRQRDCVEIRGRWDLIMRV